jgi:hypothetical protein
MVPLALALAFLAGPAAADAHLRSGTVAVDYAVSILRSDTPAYRSQVYQSDRGLGLAVKPGHVVVMLGYLGEPVFRLDAAGLWVNTASPTAVVVGLLNKANRTISTAPRWRLRRGRRSATWHDSRVQGLPVGSDRGAWHVPLIVDGRRLVLGGELRRFPSPSLWLWLGLLTASLAGGMSPLLLRRRDLVRLAAIRLSVVAAVASVLLAVAFSLDTYASPGTWIESVDEVLFIAVGLGVLLRGPEKYHVGAAIGLGSVGLAVGLLNGAVFLHPIALAILPGTLTRVIALGSIVAGLDAAALGCLFLAQPDASTQVTRSGPELSSIVAAQREPGVRGPGG